MFRFIDCLTVINNGGEFGKANHGSYLLESELKRENSSDNKASSLDLDKKIIKKFSLSI